MTRCIVIGVKGLDQTCISCGLSESEAMKVASESEGFDYSEVYINPVPFAVLKSKPKQTNKPISKKA